jgi:LL-H family phage holin
MKMEINEILMDVLKAVVSLATLLIVRYLIPWIKAQIENSKYSWLVELVADAVKYAEQTITGSGKGEEKKELVVQYITNQLQIRGIGITEDQMEALIESAVYQLKKGE